MDAGRKQIWPDLGILTSPRRRGQTPRPYARAPAMVPVVWTTSGEPRQVWLQRPSERADYCRHVPFLTRCQERFHAENRSAYTRQSESAHLVGATSTSESLLNQHRDRGVRNWHASASN